jgi:hypothetical protein
MLESKGTKSKRIDFWIVLAMIGMIVIPSILTLKTARVTAFLNLQDVIGQNPSPYGYTVSLLLFVIPILVIGLWFIPKEGIEVSQKSFWLTIGILFPLGAVLDFFFARYFFVFPNTQATLGIPAPALGGPVPVEEYIFYFTGFLAVLLMYIWLDEYWLAAYHVPGNAEERAQFHRLLHFHPESLIVAVVLVVAAIVCRRLLVPNTPGFPGYIIFLVLGALIPSTIFFPAARPVINWRALSLTLFIMLLTSMLWEVTLALPYGWWNFQDAQMIGLRIVAWDRLPIEEVFIWIAVTYATVICYEIVKGWKSSGRRARHAFLGAKGATHANKP